MTHLKGFQICLIKVMFLTKKRGERGSCYLANKWFQENSRSNKNYFYVNEMLNTAADTVGLKSFNDANKGFFM